MQNQYFKKVALESDQKFIFNLQETRLGSYHLHEKRKIEAREVDDSNFKPKYETMEINDVDILNVYIVISKGKRIGAYKLEYDSFGKCFRLFWLSKIEKTKAKRVCDFIIQQSIKDAKNKGCNLIKLSVNIENTTAIKCYKNNGFAFVDTNTQEREMITVI